MSLTISICTCLLVKPFLYQTSNHFFNVLGISMFVLLEMGRHCHCEKAEACNHNLSTKMLSNNVGKVLIITKCPLGSLFHDIEIWSTPIN